MSRFLPRSLYGQTLLVLLGGFIISQAAGWWIYSMDREQAVRAVGGFAAAQRIANLTQLVQEAPREWRERIVLALSDPTFRVTLLGRRPTIVENSQGSVAAQVISDFLATQLASGSGLPLVAVSVADSTFAGIHAMRSGPMAHGFGDPRMFRNLQVAVPLSDDQWLSFATALPEGGPALSPQFLYSMAIMVIIVLAVSVWAVRRVTTPLQSLSMAAERLGNDLNAPPVPETGTVETRQASRAFNAMQDRLRSLVDNRTRLLAAISHDLRTPLTLLRLRVENVENVPEREKMLLTIAEMDSMIGATLQFTRDEAIAELRRPTDIFALVQSVVDDMADAGMPVTMASAQSVVLECRPDALKRAIRNLIDNAVKYGHSANIAISVNPKSVEITIEDKGPGIPQEELTRVFEPFYRVEASRNLDTGGIGLGLAIALSIIQAHRGELMLENLLAGGLRASVVLPRR